MAMAWPVLTTILKCMALVVLAMHLLAELVNSLLARSTAMSYVTIPHKGSEIVFARVAKLSVAMTTGVGVLVAFGRFYAPDPWRFDSEQRRQTISLEHLFGTDIAGRDMFARILTALTNDLLILLAAVIVLILFVWLISRAAYPKWLLTWLKAPIRPLHFVPIVPAIWFSRTIVRLIPTAWRYGVPYLPDDFINQLLVYLLLIALLVSRISLIIIRFVAERGHEELGKRSVAAPVIAYAALLFMLNAFAMNIHSLVPRSSLQLSMAMELLQVRSIWALAPAASIIVFIFWLMTTLLFLMANLFASSSPIEVRLSEIHR